MKSLHDHDQLKHLLLDMISTLRPLAAERTAALSDANWETLCHMAGQHRLGPILHHQCQTLGKDWRIPDGVRSRWANAYRQSAIRALSFKKGMQELAALLESAGVSFAALKGSWLAQHAYPHPALRPMRDIDILVSPSAALLTFDLLAKSGYRRLPHDVAPVDHVFAHHKHLPALICPQSGRTVEVHTRLIEKLPKGELRHTIADTDALLQRRIWGDSREFKLPYLEPTDTLLHLIVHSACDHQFNNGPLILNDVAVILTRHKIDWIRFWRMADIAGWTRASELILELTRHYHGNLSYDDPQPRAGVGCAEVLESSALLTLLDFDETSTIFFRKEVSGKFWSREALDYFWQQAFPSKHQIAHFAKLPLESPWVWAHLPVWAFTRSRQVVFKKIDPDVTADAQRAALVEKWLGGGI